MHENKYLHLPVVDADAGMVVGVVNVMEILQATAGDKGSARYLHASLRFVTPVGGGEIGRCPIPEWHCTD